MSKQTLPTFAAPEQAGPFSITLHNTEGGSDKIYLITIQAAGDDFVVNCANGRRGSTMTPRSKTPQPVSYEKARSVCNKTMMAKISDGYRPIAGSTFDGQAVASIAVELSSTDSGVRVQLLNDITEDEARAYINDPSYICQPKKDGERRPVRLLAGAVTGINRKGQTVAIPEGLAGAVSDLGVDLLADAEQIGDTLHIFDLLELAGADLRGLTTRQRWNMLLGVFAQADVPDHDGHPIQLVDFAEGQFEKQKLFDTIKAQGGEGVVFKRVDAPYTPGRPASGGDHLKCKFYHTLSAVVAGQNEQRSVRLELIDGGTPIAVGNVTVPANQAVPQPGDVVEVRYLYAYPEGSLYQPILEGIRTDISPDECVASQRKFKDAA
jgi:bifunctional non-homologous end joining protein LigD